MFEVVLGRRVEPLLQDAMEHPENYSDELVVLLRDLYEKRRQFENLNSDEQHLLHKATFEFAQFTPPKTSKAPAVVQPKPVDTFSSVEPPRAVPGVDIPQTEMPAYWWV